MRLIDADEVLNLIDGETKVETNSNVKAFNDALEVAIQIIDTQKTVKAIPIELIEKEMKRLDEDIKWAWYYGNTALDKMEYLKMWLTIKLEDWEKENEID